MINRLILKVSTALLVAGTCLLPVHNWATIDQDECSQEILLSYFPIVFVKETLKKYNIPQERWDSISKNLIARDKEIIKIVESKAAKMDPNPLKDPQHRQEAVKLFRETLADNFTAVMNANGIQDNRQIQAMLDDIQQQKAKRFTRCMEQQKQEYNRQAPQQSRVNNQNRQNDNNDEGDEDEDDDDDEDDDND